MTTELSITDTLDNYREGGPLVSVAIITFNQAEFLRECIESVLQQDYANLEIVVADDGSTDGTQEMLRDYDRNHPEKPKNNP